MKEKTVLESYEQKRERVREFNLTSDLFAGKVFEDIQACQELCRILLQDDSVILQNAKTQYVIRNMENHSMELDILAEKADGGLVAIELQMYKETAPFKRTRYYLSGIDMSILEKGKSYDELPPVTMVYLTKEDFIGSGKGYYLIERRTEDHGLIADVGNGLKERYYNLEYPTDNPAVNELMEYFKDSNPYYRTETFPRIVERVNHFKIHKRGVNIMCEITDRIRNEGKEEGRVEGREEGRVEGMMGAIVELLEEIGQVPRRIAELIQAEHDLSVLSRWHKAAARASSIAEFEANM